MPGLPGLQLPCSAAVPGLSASLRLPLRGPGKPEALDSTGTPGALESWPLSGCGDSQRATGGKRSAAPESCPPGMANLARGSLVGSEPRAAENVLGRDRASTHSSLCTEPPTYFNPPPSLLLPPSSPCLGIPLLLPLPPNRFFALRLRTEKESFADPGSRLWQLRTLSPGLPGLASLALQCRATPSVLLGPAGHP